MIGSVLFRIVLLACCAMAATAPDALADATIEFIPAAGFHAANLQVVGDGANDQITISESSANFKFARTGGGLTVTNPAPDRCTQDGSGVVTCQKAPSVAIDLGSGDDRLSQVGLATPILATGGPDDDTLTGGRGNDVLAGADGNDTLTGNEGVDEYFGEANNDTINAFDGLAERISCGSGDDRARNDPIDIIAECEAGVDGDGDGFASFVDCNDGQPAIHPGVVDIVENGIDENCDGADARNLDRDADGFPIPADCNDAAPAIHPGVLEIRGNQVDENCDSRAPGFALLRSLVSSNWRVGRRVTRLRTLIVRNAPAGARIAVRCQGDGCPFKRTKRATVPRDLAPVSLRRFFGKAKLRRGARVRVTVTAPAFVGRTYTYRIKVGEVPATTIVCTQPGEAKGQICG
jgi:hypothetical protein